MVTDFFGAILQEIGTQLQIPNLHPDEHNTCLIKFKGGIVIQIEMDQAGEYVIVGTEFADIPVGRYRENLFAEALKANGMPAPRYGVFAYSQKKDHLSLFEMFPSRDVTGIQIADYLGPFLEKVRIWKEAISRGDMPAIAPTVGRAPGLFGLK